jgi:hypothetical protein
MLDNNSHYTPFELMPSRSASSPRLIRLLDNRTIADVSQLPYNTSLTALMPTPGYVLIKAN